jgi:hypothetical protein
LEDKLMVNVKLFKENGGKIRGLSAVTNGVGKFGAVPEVGDYVNMGEAASSPTFKVEAVAYLMNEDAVRLIVSPVTI